MELALRAKPMSNQTIKNGVPKTGAFRAVVNMNSLCKKVIQLNSLGAIGLIVACTHIQDQGDQ
jgi:hypothetical protein